MEDNRAPSLASSRSNLSEHSMDAPPPAYNHQLHGGAGGNPCISAPLQNTSLGSGAGLAPSPSSSILKPKCHQFIIREAARLLFYHG